MKIFKISQNLHNDYDTYDSAVVCAKNEEEARKIHPGGEFDYDDEKQFPKYDYSTWVTKENVKVELIGNAKKDSKRGVICSSFNAG